MDTGVCTHCYQGQIYYHCELYGEESTPCKACGGTGQIGFRTKSKERPLLGKYKTTDDWLEGEIIPRLKELEEKYGLTSSF